ncbi:hypothetical protein ABIF68_001625 [Bradyrhizobium japonicum]
MPHFKRLTLDQSPPSQVDINFDLVLYLEPILGRGGTRIVYTGNAIEVTESPDQIALMQPLRFA